MTKPNLWQSMGLAGTTAITSIHPIELIKTRLQMSILKS